METACFFEVTMKKFIIPLLACLLLSACGQLEPWEMPQLDAAPTAQPIATPSQTGTSGPEKFIWNQISGFNMADPGVFGDRLEQELSHSQSLKLFESGLLPEKLFAESYSPYVTRYLQKQSHQVLVDSQGQLMENAYVEYVYLPKNGNEKRSIRVMAELCSHETLSDIYNQRLIPHVVFSQDVKPAASSYYLERFMLFKLGELRYAQALVLPQAYFSRVSAMEAALEDGQELSLPRQALLSFSCGEDVSDEEFAAAVCRIWKYSGGTAPEAPVETPSLPQKGEKGAA